MSAKVRRINLNFINPLYMRVLGRLRAANRELYWVYAKRRTGVALLAVVSL